MQLIRNDQNGNSALQLVPKQENDISSFLFILLKVLTNEERGGLAVVSFERSGFKLISL
jgi:hypothetical protein